MEERIRLRGEELHSAIISQRREGKSYGAIAESLGCSHGVISEVLRRAGLTRRGGTQPAAEGAPAAPGAAPADQPRTVTLPSGVTVTANGGGGIVLQFSTSDAVAALLDSLGVRVSEARAALSSLQAFLASV